MPKAVTVQPSEAKSKAIVYTIKDYERNGSFALQNEELICFGIPIIFETIFKTKKSFYIKYEIQFLLK